MARVLYSLLLHLALPLILARLLWRARRQPAYRQHWGQRFGCYRAPPPGPCLWLHAVSVGETRAAQPLVTALLERYPDHWLLLTGMTPTGRETATQVFATHADRVHYVYAPYDFPFAVARFFRHFRPRAGILMETEIWPNLLAGAQQAGVPVMLANARLSARSARGYERFAALSRPAFASLASIAAQSEADAERFRRLGAKHLAICGNIKFDVTPPPAALALGDDWRQALGRRPVWLAASTREGEDEEILTAFASLNIPALLLVLVPRHPQRFDAVANLAAARGFPTQRRSLALPGPETRVWIGDSMGEMAAYYRCADVALIGGSLLPFGGQNLIEAAACGCPTLLGPYTYNFAQSAEDAVAAGAALRIAGSAELAPALQQLFLDHEKRRTMADAALSFAAAHRGATARNLALVETLAPPA
jgi:3-deoxy-D-manno-octulosonic-acid transferase